MRGGFASQLRSARAFAPPTIPLALSIGCLAFSATAQDIAAFAQERCIGPMTQGTALDTTGLQETTADALGLTPEPIGGSAPKYYIDTETGLFVGVLEFFTLRACMVDGQTEAVPMDLAQFEAIAEVHGLVIPEDCRAAPMGAETANPGQSTIAFTPERTANGRFVQVALSEFPETGTAEILAWETTERTHGMQCGVAQ